MSDLAIPLSPELSFLPAKLVRQAYMIGLDSGEALFRRGDMPVAIHCLRAGEVRLVRYSRDGREVVLQRSRGGFFAEASIDAAGYHCDAVAAVPSRVLAVPLVPFKAEMDANADFRRAWGAHLAAELRHLRNRCERLALPTARERLIHYIDSEGQDGVLHCDQGLKSLAVELGITHEALYRTVAKLEREGCVAREGRGLLRLLR